MSVVTIPYYLIKCEQCSLGTLGHATEAAARLAFAEYFGVVFPDGRALCSAHLTLIAWCHADREGGYHTPDPDEPAVCLFCGWPVEVPA